jgi:hypothetical protein
LPSLQRVFGIVCAALLVTGVTYAGQGKNSATPRGGALPLQVEPSKTRGSKPQMVQPFQHIPVRFELNQGQTDPQVEFLSRGQGYALFLADDEAVLSLKSKASKTANSKQESQSIVRMKLAGARPSQAEGLDRLPTKSNYIIGSDPTQWRTNIPNYGMVKYAGVYPGIDLVYYGNERQLEYDFVVAPGADPRTVRFAIAQSDLQGEKQDPESNIRELSIASNGDLAITVEGGEVRFQKPFAYQTVGGQRHEIEASYKLQTVSPKSGETEPKYEVSFQLAAYDSKLPLVIDPVLSYSTLLGGTNYEEGIGIASDSSGNIYVAGTTVSANFPTKNPILSAAIGNEDVFVTKIDAAGATLTYSTYLGGSGVDRPAGMVLDSSGNIFVAGTTTSLNFPTTIGVFQAALAAGACGTDTCPDAFVAKIKADGTGIMYSTYLGGTGTDAAGGITIDSTGNAYVAGTTNSLDFPTASPFQAALSGTGDAYLTKIKPDGTGLIYSTYLGGGASDLATSVALDISGQAWVGGYTLSTDFPTVNPIQGSNHGMTDGFIAAFNAAGDVLVYSTYLGGTDTDRVRTVVLDAADNVYAGGETYSADFPVSASPIQSTFGGGTCGLAPCPDGFLTKLDPTGANEIYSTYLGGTSSDQVAAIAVNAAEEAFVTGSTTSSDFPLQNPIQATIGGGTCPDGGCSDVFVARVNASGSGLDYSTFLGGTDADAGRGIFVDGTDNAFVTGFAGSIDFPATPGAFQTSAGGTSSSGDAFVAKIGPADASSLIIAPIKLTFADQPKGFTSDPLTITLKNIGTGPITFSSIAVTGDFAQTNTCEPALAISSATCTISVTFTPTTSAALTGELTITTDSSGSPHKIALAGKGIDPASKMVFDPTTLTFPDTDINATSAPLTVIVSNTGYADITITKVESTGEYTQTNNCPITPSKLVIGATCTANVTFAPKGSGARAGGLVITSDAGNAQKALNSTTGTNALNATGNGIGVYTISGTPTDVTIKRGVASTTFTVTAAGPSSFTSAITLGCQSGNLGTCSFSPASIKVGETSTLTYSSLDSVTPKTHTFVVRGVNDLQYAETSFTVNFIDYSIESKPTFGTVASGDSFTFQVKLTSTEGFDGSASFACSGLPQESSCSFSPGTAALDGINPATVDVTVKTTTRTVTWAPPRPPSVPSPWLPVGVGTLAILFVLGFRRRGVRLLLFSLILLGMILMASCNEYYYYTYTGTLPGTFPITVTSTVGTVKHSATFVLTVI